ncbi:MAG: nucleotide exchange factor GrpE [Oscillospiraceae bacterium]|nr:nucleotide exchange factor GrpE [Oscillospiraceae bacterium]
MKKSAEENIKKDEILEDGMGDYQSPADETADEASDEPVDPVEALEKELAGQKEMYLRLAAEYDNFRKRTQREKEALFDDITADCAAVLLPTVDNLERALAAPEIPENDPMKAGVEMVLSNTLAAFAKIGVVPFGETGEAFDPNLHHCVSTAESEDFPGGHITLVMQKGYALGDKVVRPAMVAVSE